MEKPLAQQRNDRYMLYLLVVLCVMLLAVLYYYKKILNRPVPVINVVYAQTFNTDILSKKKTFFP